MSGTDDDWAPPPFNAEHALQQIKRALRVAELVVTGAGIDAKLARKLALTPEWDKSTLKSSTDQRKWVDELKKRLERWDREE
jgi:hypothetical protein